VLVGTTGAAHTAGMSDRPGGRTGFGPGGQVTNAFLCYAEQAAEVGDATDEAWPAPDDGILHVAAGTVCMSCFRTMTARQAARRSPDGWRHERCPS
jgi:hypothetical protein